MPVALSRGARALFKACLTGEPTEDRFNTLYFYDELGRAGLMARDGGSSFQLTEEGEARRWEFLPHPDGPSAAAMDLLRRHLEGERIDASDDNRSAYRELAATGLMMAGHSFSGGDESIYVLTEEGFGRKAELLARAKMAG